MPLNVRATQRFIRDFDRAQPLLRACALGALSDIRRAFEQRPDIALRRYKKVAGISPAVREVDIAGAERLLFHWRDGEMFLLAVGSHEVVGHYQETGKVDAEIARCKPLPQRIADLTAAGYFTFDVEEEWRDFANEADPAWLSYLAPQQAQAVDRVLSRTLSGSSRDWHFSLIVGGPGTGKTSVLLNLFDRAFECDLQPQIIISDEVAAFIKSAAGIDLEGYRTTIESAARESAGGILLVDDPNSARDVERVRVLAQQRHFRAVVVGVDPLQLSGEFDDSQFDSLLAGRGSDLISLNVCYRQKRAVGESTKRALDAIALSSPFLAEEKKVAFSASRSRITALANTMEFANPAGRCKTMPEARASDIAGVVDQLLRSRGLWAHWAPFLVAYDDEGLGSIPASWRPHLKRLERVRELRLSDALDIKGVEYQHAIIILSHSLFFQLQQGFEGATRRIYDKRKLLRIPISRAKDSVTIAVCIDAH